MAIRKMTAKQQRFVNEYLIDLNATQAAIRAGYSARSADKIGHQLLGKTRIDKAISEAKEAQAKRTSVTADMVIRGLYEEATYTGDGASHSARVAAWGWLGKHFGSFLEKQEISGPGGAPITIESLFTRIEKAEASSG